MQRSRVRAALAVALAAGGLVVLAFAAGCASKAVEATPTDVTTRTKPMPSQSRALSPGQSVTMANGLTFTVPTGWTGKLMVNTDGSTQSEIMFGGIGVTEYCTLQPEGATSKEESVIIESCWDASSQVPESFDRFREVVDKPSFKVLMGAKPFPSDPIRLYQARLRVPGAHEEGLILFGGPSADPIKATRTAWTAIALKGVKIP
jgi:hypothetical protein